MYASQTNASKMTSNIFVHKVESTKCNLLQRIYAFLRLHVQDLPLLSQGQIVPCGT